MLIFADFQDQFVSPQVKKGDFVLYYLSKIEEEKVKLNRKLLDQKGKNRVLLAAVRALIKHWKRPEDKAEELKLFKDAQNLVSDYEGMRNLGQILSDSSRPQKLYISSDLCGFLETPSNPLGSLFFGLLWTPLVLF